ncbi:MAG TPA: AMP-binding protein, partial [Casimicrobiaceae bacterium]|nr:AMP-binding protein [Casimicrobiaceae bacterium]
AVVGRPHGADEEVVAFVELGAGAAATPRELLDFLAARIAGHELPAVLRIVAALPALPSGKPDRATMRRLAASLARE